MVMAFLVVTMLLFSSEVTTAMLNDEAQLILEGGLLAESTTGRGDTMNILRAEADTMKILMAEEGITSSLMGEEDIINTQQAEGDTINHY
ncbi:hypothetical protein GH714_000318 [Hevea brasiliensis]|uniref:Secreted protein n=1 Tax=Hevea brasiliensis TaxID=3981 RepID=A0A6A6L970_HEVBR|nr:hypothetical protein GH714_000318 [Hevea brasiliensis]